jgi:mRNA-degrading endonuclease toxin of MazEF toxin-antitoxin module
VAQVLRRHAPLLGAAFALVAAVVALVLVLRHGGDETKRSPAHGEPLAYLPAAGGDLVFDVDTREPLLALAVEELVRRVTRGALTAEQVHPLLGGEAVVETERGKTWLAFATDQDAPRPTRGAAAAKRGGVVVIAPTAADLRASLIAAGEPAAKYARATFDKRFAGLPARSSARVAFDPRAILQQRAPKVLGTRWARSLRDGAAVLTTSGNELRVPFRITADPVGLTPDDLPIATGATSPRARGNAPLTIGVRDPARTLAFARAAGLLPALDFVDDLPGFVRPNLGDLGPNGTITNASPSDLSHLTLRTEPPDPGDWSRKLSLVNTIGDIAKGVGGSGFGIEHRGGEYAFSQDGEVVARAGVYGPALVLSNDPKANLRQAAVAPAAPTPNGAAGALTARLRSSALATQIPALVRARLGDLTAWVRAELTGVTGELRLALR